MKHNNINIENLLFEQIKNNIITHARPNVEEIVGLLPSTRPNDPIIPDPVDVGFNDCVISHVLLSDYLLSIPLYFKMNDGTIEYIIAHMIVPEFNRGVEWLEFNNFTLPNTIKDMPYIIRKLLYDYFMKYV